MSQIDELQSRIVAAMDRLGQALERMPEPGSGAGQETAALTELQTALDEEKLANAQLEERLRAIRTKHDGELAALRAQLGEQTDAMSRLDTDLQRLRKAAAQLRDSNAALREANQAGVGEPHLINKAMLAELEALRAARAADIAEAGAIMGALEPLLAAANGEEI